MMQAMNNLATAVGVPQKTPQAKGASRAAKKAPSQASNEAEAQEFAGALAKLGVIAKDAKAQKPILSEIAQAKEQLEQEKALAPELAARHEAELARMRELATELQKRGLAGQSQLAPRISLQELLQKGPEGLEKSVDRDPATRQAAASANTGAAIAGLKPWSREWVFTGDEQDNPDLKPLFGGSQNEEMLKLVKQAQEQTKTTASQAAQNAQQRGEAAKAAASDPRLARLAELSAQIEAMNGAVTGAKAQQVAAPAQTQMSGAEFVQALNDAKVRPMEHGAKQGEAELGNRSGLRAQPELVNVKKHAVDPKAELAALVGGGSALAHARTESKPAELSGYVIPGAGAKDRLASASLQNISGQIHTISTQGGSGEMRIHLKPENLGGELNLMVSTMGQNVSLKIQASNEHAKKVLEESISYLKESLAGHHLSLAAVDVSVAQAAKPGTSGDQAQHQAAHQSFDGLMRQDAQQGNAHSGAHSRAQDNDLVGAREERSAPRVSGLAQAQARSRAFGAGHAPGDGRIDVIA